MTRMMMVAPALLATTLVATTTAAGEPDGACPPDAFCEATEPPTPPAEAAPAPVDEAGDEAATKPSENG